MKTFFFYAAVLVVCMRVGWAAEALQQNRQPSSSHDADGDQVASERIFGTGVLTFGGSTGATSITIGNAGYIALGAALLVPLIIGLALLFYLYGGPRDSDSASSGSYGSTGYDTHARSVLK
ncbi:hypothetical protein Pcinc_044075 [Petrolisthes cinctipes]|uniref:Uncharacterized protein n=1 Tax=Petrolisthes cinctipes TaxID=88211 RepID=A0AAE1EEK5_PETCI|nr:hypothetical protein Pcinc_044075 [Petrolisthes cinctipes]